MLMMLPALIILVGVGVFPLGNSLRLAASRWTLTKDPAPVFAGAENLREMFADARFGRLHARLVRALFGGSMGKGFADCAQGLKKAAENRA